MDDTLVQTRLDFAAIKNDIGCPADEDILTYIEKMSCPQEQRKANQIVLEHELSDAQTSVWLPGAQAFVESAKLNSLPLAIVTRNSRQATQIKLNNNRIAIENVITREDAPAKPDPTALLTIAQDWQIAPQNIAYLGDYIYDIQAAHNADMQAWLYEFRASAKDYHDCLSFIAKI